MLSKNKFLLIAAPLIAMLACAFSANSFAGAPTPCTPLTGDNTVLTSITTPTRIESSARSWSSGGSNGDNQLVVWDGSTANAEVVNYNYTATPIIHVASIASFLPSNAKMTDVRINHDASAAIVVWFETASGTTKLQAEVLGSSGPRSSNGFTFIKSSLHTIATFTGTFNDLSVDIDQSDEVVISWAANGTVFGVAATLPSTTLTLGSVMAIAGTGGVYNSPPPATTGPKFGLEGADAAIFDDSHIVSFTFTDDNLTHTTLGLMQFLWSDLNSGGIPLSHYTSTPSKVKMDNTLISSPTGSAATNLLAGSSGDVIEHPRIAVPYAAYATTPDKYDYTVVVHHTDGLTFDNIDAFTYWLGSPAASYPNIINSTIGTSPTALSTKVGYNSHPEVVYSEDLIIIQFAYNDAVSTYFPTPFTGNKLAIAYKMPFSGAPKYNGCGSTADCMLVNATTTGVTTPGLATSDLSSSNGDYYEFYSYYDGSGTNILTRYRTSGTDNKTNPNYKNNVIGNPNGDNIFDVYPNPAIDQVIIKPNNTGDITGDINVDITDIMGRIIKHLVLKANNFQPIDIRDLSNGTYLLQIINNGNRSISKLIIARN